MAKLPQGFVPLIGTEEATVDDKGRILFSKKKRERLGESFTIAFGAAGCLVAYPKLIWDGKLEEIFGDESAHSQGRDQYTRLFLGLADDELKFDGQGRVVLPQKMRDIARLKEKDKVLLVGCGDRVEIWAVGEWDKYNEDPSGYGVNRRAAIESAYNLMVGR